MEVMLPQSPPTNFNFSNSTSPYTTAPSTPHHRLPTFFYSAPTSPTSISRAYFDTGDSPSSSVPFDWEEKPGISKLAKQESHIDTATSSNYGDVEEELEDIDFAFDFSGHLERSSLSADELFDGGKIKPLKPPPRFQYVSNKSFDSPKSPKSPKGFIKEAFSPRHRKRDFDPFAAAIIQTRKENFNNNNKRSGRERTRSLSPLRVSDLLVEPQSELPTKNSSFASFWYKKWKIKDLLLFRSASESRASDDKEQLRKYGLLKKARENDVKNSSFRSTDSAGSVSSMRRSGPSISAHELHYTAKREEMKRRTFLPYRQGLLGCLGFHKTVSDISRGIASTTSSMSRGR